MMRKVGTWIARSVYFIYKVTLSPIFGRSVSCRYTPTCSEYMVQSIEKHGLVRGFARGIRRFSTCHPWSKKDFYDPVE